MHNDPLVKLEHADIPVVDEYKFLDGMFDRKLSYIAPTPYKIPEN